MAGSRPDRPHELKLSGSYLFPFGTQFGFFQYLGSGTPVSRQVNVISSTPMFYLGRESDGRLPVYTQTDLRVSHDVRIGGKRSLNVYVDVLNLFDQETAVRRFKVGNPRGPSADRRTGVRGLRHAGGHRGAQHPARSAVPAGRDLPGPPRRARRRALPVLVSSFELRAVHTAWFAWASSAGWLARPFFHGHLQVSA